MQVRQARVDTSLGEVTIVAAGDAVVGLYFPQHWYRPPAADLGPTVDVENDQVLLPAGRQLAEYLRGERTTFDLTTAATGNPFQKKVWALLDQIPIGETTTYGELAEQLGEKALAQAVGQAVGHNPISIVVPCHRVVGKGGKLTGYAGGLRRKQFLLDLEAPPTVTEAMLF
jgi:methylated-DNA-[protein]-cysteine S-methyltransferase